MRYEELIILLPCHSLEDFPRHHEGDDADSLLACWTALWHPALLVAAQAAPNWYRVDNPPEVVSQRLVVVPTVSARDLPTGFSQRVKAEGGHLIRKGTQRAEILAQALAPLDPELLAAPLDDDLVADFLALGYAYLQIQLLTRQMRYTSNLDEPQFRRQLLAAANAAGQGQPDVAREKLASCFNLLAEERDHYYSVDAYLIDLTLVASTTFGEPLRQELSDPRRPATNLLLSGVTLRDLHAQDASTFEQLQSALEGGRAALVGGEDEELALSLLSCESLRDNFLRGRQAYQKLLDRHPEVFGRRRFGLTPILPQLLRKLGFRGGLHATLDDGRFPSASQAKTRWQGPDGSLLDVLGRPPQDASKPETFLGLANRLGESMDHDHVATLALAHWPGKTSCWYEDLRRCAHYGNALGKFLRLDRYFQDTMVPGQVDSFDADGYLSPYLKQAVIRREADPLASWTRYWQRQVQRQCAGHLRFLAALLERSSGAAEAAFSPRAQEPENAPDGELADALQQLAARLPRRREPSQNGYLVFNPHSFVRRVGLTLKDFSGLPAIERPIYAAARVGQDAHVVVDVPPLGFAWITPSSSEAREKRPPLPLAEEGLLRNEFFEAIINEHTGSLQAIHAYNTRGNRLSQQLALRLPGGSPRRSEGRWVDPDETALYSVMAADEIRVTAASSAFGEITTRGRLLSPQGAVQAHFQQKYQIWRGSRLLRVEIELDPQQEPEADPWNSYYACRFAWADEAAGLWRAVNEIRQPAESKRLEAPLYLEIDAGETRTAILTGGLPFHRRTDPRMLDSLLIVRGDAQRRFTFGVGVDVNYPLQEALGLLTPAAHLALHAPPPAPADSAWLFHLDARNVVATHWSVWEQHGHPAGFRVRLLETSGRGAQLKLSSFRPLTAAQQLDFTGGSLGPCRIEEGRVCLELAASEWVEVEARWS